MLQVAQGIQGIVSLINFFTAASTANAVAQGASAAAAQSNAVSQGMAAVAAVPAIAANKLLAASYVQLAAAEYYAAHAYIPFAGFGIASEFAIATEAMVQAFGLMAFANGGIVGGNSPTGDRILARVNSGEMILNKSQQQRLLALLSGAVQPVTLPQRTMQPVTLDVSTLGTMLDRQPITITGDFRLQGKDLVASASNYTRIANKSGHRF